MWQIYLNIQIFLLQIFIQIFACINFLFRYLFVYFIFLNIQIYPDICSSQNHTLSIKSRILVFEPFPKCVKLARHDHSFSTKQAPSLCKAEICNPIPHLNWPICRYMPIHRAIAFSLHVGSQNHVFSLGRSRGTAKLRGHFFYLATFSCLNLQPVQPLMASPPPQLFPPNPPPCVARLSF